VSDLTNTEKRKLEQALGMRSGYVLDFSDRTFGEFVDDSVGRDIFDAKYNYASGSKANRLRAFWKEESNAAVGRLLRDLLDYAAEQGLTKDETPELIESCGRTVNRLLHAGPVADLDDLASASDGRDFDIVAKAVRDAIERNEPEAALDRLHTFVVKFVRVLCDRRGIATDREKPLHSLFGEYVKRLREAGQIESEMTLRILKSSISTLEAFNDVRNTRSLAHDNAVLNYDEALLICNHATSSIRFLRALEDRIARQKSDVAERSPTEDDIPF
jgi:hypothetical protein